MTYKTRINLISSLVSLVFLGWISICSAHGLTITTASVIIRNQTHLILRLQYDPLRLLERISIARDQPPPHLGELANLSDDLFENQYGRIQSFLATHLSIQLDGIPIHSLRFRFPTSQYFRKTIREQFMAQVIDSHSSTSVHDHQDDRRYYQVMEVDGFLPEDGGRGDLSINFPPELGQIMVTYSEPKTQTLTPSQSGSFYHHEINRGER